MRPPLLLFLLLWGFLLAPALCTAGELTHPCDCGETIQCDHEEQCTDDPCADLAVVVQPDPDPGDVSPSVLTHPLDLVVLPTALAPVDAIAPPPAEPAFPAGPHPLRN